MDNCRDKLHDKQHIGTHCGIYDTGDFRRYLTGAMSEREKERLESHCSECDECSVICSQVNRVLYEEKEQRENAILLQKTMSLLDKLDRE